MNGVLRQVACENLQRFSSELAGFAPGAAGEVIGLNRAMIADPVNDRGGI